MTGSYSHTGIILLSRRCLAIVNEYGRRLGDLHARRPGLVEQALAVYARAFWPSLRCPVFKGFDTARSAHRLLSLLCALQVPQVRVICFAAPESWIAARWERLLGWPRARMSFRRPPNSASPATLKWIAIDALFPASGKSGELSYTAATGFSFLLRVAQLTLIEQKRAESARHKEPGGMAQDSDAPEEKPPPG